MTEKSESAPITVSLRGVLQSAADFSITMIAGGNHTLIKEADVAIRSPIFGRFVNRPYDIENPHFPGGRYFRAINDRPYDGKHPVGDPTGR